jgi:hypothetical protein
LTRPDVLTLPAVVPPIWSSCRRRLVEIVGEIGAGEGRDDANVDDELAAIDKAAHDRRSSRRAEICRSEAGGRIDPRGLRRPGQDRPRGRAYRRIEVAVEQKDEGDFDGVKKNRQEGQPDEPELNRRRSSRVTTKPCGRRKLRERRHGYDYHPPRAGRVTRSSQ